MKEEKTLQYNKLLSLKTTEMYCIYFQMDVWCMCDVLKDECFEYTKMIV